MRVTPDPNSGHSSASAGEAHEPTAYREITNHLLDRKARTYFRVPSF